jgi:addiction module HigA family antidote
MPRTPIHPGEHLADELHELRLSARELARAIKVPTTRITDILRGRRGISGDTALRLGQYFAVSPDFWMNLQKLYELDLARLEIGEQLAEIPRHADHKSQRREPTAAP